MEQHARRLIRRFVAMSDEDGDTAQVDFEVFWAISQYAGTPSPVHDHSCVISRVLYLKVNEVERREELRTYVSGRQAGYVNFLIGGKQRFSKSLISFSRAWATSTCFPDDCCTAPSPSVAAANAVRWPSTRTSIEHLGPKQGECRAEASRTLDQKRNYGADRPRTHSRWRARSPGSEPNHAEDLKLTYHGGDGHIDHTQWSGRRMS